MVFELTTLWFKVTSLSNCAMSSKFDWILSKSEKRQCRMNTTISILLTYMTVLFTVKITVKNKYLNLEWIKLRQTLNRWVSLFQIYTCVYKKKSILNLSLVSTPTIFLWKGKISTFHMHSINIAVHQHRKFPFHGENKGWAQVKFSVFCSERIFSNQSGSTYL